jgi:hypothetical protein
MTFHAAQSSVETAGAELARAREDTTGWSSPRRRAFDQEHLKPLADAAVTLITALKRVQEAQARAERLMSG